jgi:NADPH:quinone reductase-like Zn-dependent oxidoreductase
VAVRAIIFEQHGGPEVLELRDVSGPAVSAHERIEARQAFGRVVLVR